MNDHEALLVAALRSGDYKRGRRRLRPTEDTFCCLGVACDVYRKETGVGEWLPPGGDFLVGMPDTNVREWRSTEYLEFAVPDETKRVDLPTNVQQWLGWQSDRFQNHLSCLNDAGYSFNAIADVIETGWPE